MDTQEERDLAGLVVMVGRLMGLDGWKRSRFTRGVQLPCPSSKCLRTFGQFKQSGCLNWGIRDKNWSESQNRLGEHFLWDPPAIPLYNPLNPPWGVTNIPGHRHANGILNDM